jgi:hypothetical protein
LKLKSAIYLLVSPVFMIFAALACGTIVTDLAHYTCPTAIPQPTSTVLPGTPEPTMMPPPTPFSITPPGDFYVGDAVFVGQQDAPLRTFEIVRARYANLIPDVEIILLVDR